MSKIIGIDLGTTNSAVAYIDRGKPRIVMINGRPLLPSVVGIDNEGKILVGEPARNQYLLYPERTVKSVKRHMGSDQHFSLGKSSYSPQEISAFILRQLKESAERELGEKVEKAVITVPAHFSDAQRQATKDAGEIAGLEVVRIINEPTAAALAYSMTDRLSAKVLVYDLGGGTFDVSIVEINGDIIEVLASSGDNELGGDDFDEAIVQQLATSFQSEHGIDLRKERRSESRLVRAAELAKIQLSDRPYIQITENFLAQKDGEPLNLSYELSRMDFNSMIQDMLTRTVDCVRQVLKDAKLDPHDIDQVVLVGGSTLIPLVSEILTEELNKQPDREINPAECVAIGAAIQAGIIAGEEIDKILVDVAPHSLGVSCLDFSYGIPDPDAFSVIIPRNTPIPCSKSEVYYTVHDHQKAVEIEVYQGESKTASENVFLGNFTLTDLPDGKAGEVKIIVNFDYDIDGIVRVSAAEKTGGKEKAITITDAKERMSQAEIARARAAMASAEYASGELPVATQELVKEARAAIDKVDPRLAKKLKNVISALEEAWQQEDDARFDELEDALIDLLYEADEQE
ncbi:MAG: Hsp70 family protein [Limnochordia bacterium]|nr:Hsp70 family protein [Limnochordia bacterium]MDD4518272.1 Hsp70 family protein [Limnochordia bacterium]